MPIVVKSTPPSTDKTSKNYKTWKENQEQYKTQLRIDSTTMGLLNSFINSTQSGHIANLSTSKEIWDTLHQINVKDQQSLNVYALVEEIQSMNWDSVTPMPDHIGKMIDIYYRIVKGKGTMNDIMLAYAIFHLLSNNNIEYNILKTSLIKKGSSLTLSQAIMSLNGLYDYIT